MTDKLKTLNDLPKYFHGEELKAPPRVSVEELKAEAIKDIKFLKEKEEKFGLFDALGSYDNSNVIDYIKWKNNITGEDLK